MISLDNADIGDQMRFLDLQQIGDVVEELGNDGVDGIILCPSKSGNMGVGVYLPEVATRLTNREIAVEGSRRGQQAIAKVDNCPKPVIAAVTGYCLGGMLELSMASDYRLAATGARFWLPEKTIGIYPGWGGSVRARYHLGQQAEDFIETPRIYNVKDALENGLIDLKLDSPDDLMYAARAWIKDPNMRRSNSRKSFSPQQSHYDAESRRFGDCFINGPPLKLINHRFVKSELEKQTKPSTSP